MAMYISVPRDLTIVKTKVFFNLTKRQIICFGIGAAIGVPIFFLVKSVAVNISFATMAESIGVHLSTFYRKVESEGENFTIGEVHKMVAHTPMTRTEAISIFLPEYSQ